MVVAFLSAELVRWELIGLFLLETACTQVLVLVGEGHIASLRLSLASSVTRTARC